MAGDLCVILPCAGKGLRLGTPYPKELMATNHGEVLIDHCFNLLKPYAGRIRVVVIVSSYKMETVKYLEKYRDIYDIVFCYQKSHLPEIIGALWSCEDLFLKHNLVLLPDTITETLTPDEDIINKTIDCLSKTPCTYWVKKESDSQKLARFGALRIEDVDGKQIVTDHVDKPKSDLEKFNGFWTAFGFNLEAAQSCLETIDKLTRKLPDADFKNSALNGSLAIEVKEFYDLGVWDAVYNYFEGKLCKK